MTISVNDQKSYRIRKYLKELSPRAVESLARNLERARDAGSADENAEEILAACLELLRSWEPSEDEGFRSGSRSNQVQRQFFEPLEDFLINEFLPSKQEGRIERVILSRIWHWLGRDVVPEDMAELMAAAENEKVPDELLSKQVNAFRKRTIVAMEKYLDRVEMTDKIRRNLTIEMGGERGLANLKDVVRIFAADREWLGEFLETLPDMITEKEFREGTRLMSLVKELTKEHADRMAIIASAVESRAEHDGPMCAFAARLTGSDNTRLLEKSPYAPFVDVVVSEVERLAILAIEHRRYNPDPVAFARALEDYRRLVSVIERDLDLKVLPLWSSRISATKRELSDVIAKELDGVHNTILTMLKVPAVEPDGSFYYNQGLFDEAVRALHVLLVVSNSKDTFAVNDVGMRTRYALEQTLEYRTQNLLQALGKAGEKERDAVLMAVNGAILLSEIYYGSKFAQQLRRSRQSALSKIAAAKAA